MIHKYGVPNLAIGHSLGGMSILNAIKQNLAVKKAVTIGSGDVIQDIIDDYIIYGTGNAGKQVYQRLSSQNQKIYCFVDDDFNKQDNTLYGKKIISSKELDYLSKIKIIKNLSWENGFFRKDIASKVID